MSNRYLLIQILLCRQDKFEQAVEIYALATRYPTVANAQLFEDIAGKQVAQATATLPPAVRMAAQECGRSRELRTTAAELLAELREVQGIDEPSRLANEKDTIYLLAVKSSLYSGPPD